MGDIKRGTLKFTSKGNDGYDERQWQIDDKPHMLNLIVYNT